LVCVGSANLQRKLGNIVVVSDAITENQLQSCTLPNISATRLQDIPDKDLQEPPNVKATLRMQTFDVAILIASPYSYRT
jgi:hypothetical protein